MLHSGPEEIALLSKNEKRTTARASRLKNLNHIQLIFRTNRTAESHLMVCPEAQISSAKKSQFPHNQSQYPADKTDGSLAIHSPFP